MITNVSLADTATAIFGLIHWAVSIPTRDSSTAKPTKRIPCLTTTTSA